MIAMAGDSGSAFTFPAIRGRKMTAAFDGGRLTSDGGVLLLAQAERDQSRVIHPGVGSGRGRKSTVTI